MPERRLILHAFIFLCLMASGFAAVASSRPVVWLALSDPGGPYGEAAETIRTELQRAGNPAEVIVSPWQQLAGQPAPNLVVAIGVSALDGIRQAGWPHPLLATLVPRAAWDSGTVGAGNRTQSAIWLDQPLTRQLDFLRIAVPSNSRVAVLLGPTSRSLEPDLMKAAAERNQPVVAARANSIDQLPLALQRVLDDADVLLALPDPQVFNALTVQNILAATFRRRIPLAAFSPSYVKAGAMFALYSTPAQVGAQAAETVRAFLAGRPLPPAQGPRDFSVSVNPGVGRSLGISIEPDAAGKWAEMLRAKDRSQ